jgi:hypothetical protein
MDLPRVRDARRWMAAEARASASPEHRASAQISEADLDESRVERIGAEAAFQAGTTPSMPGRGVTRPEALADEIGMSAKVLRAWLRRKFPRDPSDHWQPWHLTHEQAAAAKAHFGAGRYV